MALATLSIDLVAKLTKLEADMGQAARIAEKGAAQMEGSLRRLQGTANTVGAALGAYLTVDVFKRLVMGSADALDALNDLKDATGSSIENLSALEYVALRNGETLDTVSGILVKFNGVLKEADGKNGVSQALRAIGLDAEELKRVDPAQALERVAVALKGFADDGTKARIVQELFGKSIRDAAPFLNDLADMGLKNATATTEQALAAERFNKELSTMSANMSILGRSIVSDALPALNQLLSKFNNEGFMALFGFDKKFSRASALADKAKELRDAKTELDRINGVGLSGALYSRIGDARKAQERPAVEARYQRALKSFRDANFAEQNQRNEERLGPLYAGYVPREPDVRGPPAPSDLLARRMAADAAESAKQNRIVRNVGGGSGGSRAGRTKPDSVEESDPLGDLAWRKVADSDARIEAERDRARQAMYERAQQYLDAAMTDAERLQQTLEEIKQLYDDGAFGAVGSADAIEKMNKALEGAKRGTDDLKGSYLELSDAIKAALFDGADFGEMLENIAKKKFLIDPLSNAIDNIFKALQNGGGAAGGVGGGGGLGAFFGLGGLFGAVGGLLGFAQGGDPPVGVPYLVGERGPELRIDRTPGRIIPNHKLGGVGGAVVNITQHVTIGEGVSAAQVAAAMNYTKEATTQSVMQALRRNNPGLVA